LVLDRIEKGEMVVVVVLYHTGFVEADTLTLMLPD
jgi:hypothetical protein